MSNADRGQKRKKHTPGTVRVGIVFSALIAQLVLLAYTVALLRHNAIYLYFFLEIAGALVVVLLVAKNRNSSYTIVWLIVMMIMPVFGYLLFLLWGTTGLTHRKSREIRKSIAFSRTFLKQDSAAYGKFSWQHPDRQRLEKYLQNEGFPIYGHTGSRYYPLGDLQFAELIEDLQQASKFVFIEYFIIAEGELWTRIHSILRQKARQGLEVRILYDDLGSATKISDSLIGELQSENIQVVRFNPVHSNLFRMFINYRNHQKITVIDGNIGYTGGTNLADEYANLVSRLGHWKDTAIRLEGEAVWSLTVTFLQMWDSEAGSQSDYKRYTPAPHGNETGFYQPFTDNPLNNPHNPAQDLYLQIISAAHRYVYITTPYLVIDNIMKDTLCMAAQGGVDVRIVTPKIWDHWYVHMVTQSNYEDLMAAGVKIYEYTPGFIHSKVIISDDDNGVVGTINMDYRSFFVHFEDGVWMCGAPVLQEIKKDMADLFSVSEEINPEEWRTRPQPKKIIQFVLRIFAPLF